MYAHIYICTHIYIYVYVCVCIKAFIMVGELGKLFQDVAFMPYQAGSTPHLFNRTVEVKA